ncbi:MAG: hypothetical protein LBU27_06890 [Candidatus Peribacteria bacterium]|nr:hypothetical protein [Candidatus Peribacteria bacterium]
MINTSLSVNAPNNYLGLGLVAMLQWILLFVARNSAANFTPLPSVFPSLAVFKPSRPCAVWSLQ